MASKFHKRQHMTFTTRNVQRAVRDVKNSDHLGFWLGVPESKQNEIKRRFSSVPQQVKAYINYFMEHDPVASWRAVIVALDWMGEKKAADAIRHLAEPITDPTLTINNLRLVTASVENWYGLGWNSGSLGVPVTVCNAIRYNTAYKTEEEKKEALLLYYLRTMPIASWPSVAGALHYREEKTALQAVKVFLKSTPADPSLSPENLSTVLDSMEDYMWRSFSYNVNIPESDVMKIIGRYSGERERKQAVIPHIISTHPALSWRLLANALYRMRPVWSNTCHGALDCLQQQFPTGRYRSKQIYELEMQRGHFDLVIDKVVMFGIAGSGKTTALAALLGVDPPSIRSSTPLMRRPIEVMFMDVNEELHWKMRTNKKFRDTVAEVIHSRMSLQESEAMSSGSPASPSQQPSHATPSPPHRLTSEKTRTSTPEVAGKSTASSEKKPEANVQSVAEVSLDSLLQSSEVDEEFVSLINSSPPSSKPILQLRQMLVLDSGGQPQFHELMSIFLNGASKFVYVFRIHDRLNERSMIRYFVSDELLFEFPASQTNEETLKQCTCSMNSLTAKNPDTAPSRLLFLATHRDMVAAEKLPGVLDTLHKRLREILLPQFKEQIVFCDSTTEDFIFTLNGKKPVKKDEECAEAIRRCLSGKKEGSKVVKVPLRWYALYYQLVEVSEGLRKKVLSRKQCGKVAESMRIDEGSCEEALNFFNRLNMLFYFPDILADLVFIDPQIVLDKVTELVEESYRMSQGKKNQPLRPMPGDKLKFRDYGHVTEKFLSKFDSHYEAPLFTPKELVTLLKGLLVFADLSEDVYFMPCLLQVVSSEVVARYRVSEEKALAVHFPDSGPLLGMFCCTVAYLLSPDNAYWEVVTNEAGTPICLNRNVIQFTIPKMVGTVSLVDHFTHFEIHVHTHPKKAAQMWRLVHDAVFAGMEEARKTLSYIDNTPVAAIVCPAHPTTPHPATVEDDGAWTCSKMSQISGVVPKDTIPWWTLCTIHSTVPGVSSLPSIDPQTHLPTCSGIPNGRLEEVISDENLAIIARHHVTNWESLSAKLELNLQQKERIRKLYPGDYRKQKQECLDIWKQMKGNEATYSALITAAKNAAHQQLADGVKAMLAANVPLSTHRKQQSTVLSVSPVPPSVPSDEQPSAHTLDINDLFDVYCEMLNVAHNWRGVGRALRLHPDLLNMIGADHSDVTGRLEGVLTEWLKRGYDTNRFGLPSWQLLVTAVAHPAGGKDHALAGQIAGRYNVPPPPPLS